MLMRPHAPDSRAITQQKFEAQTSKAQGLEPMRFQLYDMALRLIQSDHEIEAYLLILATWNFARFRFVTRSFDLEQFRQTIAEVSPIFAKLDAETFESADLDSIAGDIAAIYSRLRPLVEQTGASKIMHFKQPRLFVMWDTEIRRHYRIPDGRSPNDYIDFLRLMRITFGHLRWAGQGRTFAKAIDEYNFVLADRKRRQQRRKTRPKPN